MIKKSMSGESRLFVSTSSRGASRLKYTGTLALNLRVESLVLQAP